MPGSGARSYTPKSVQASTTSAGTKSDEFPPDVLKFGACLWCVVSEGLVHNAQRQSRIHRLRRVEPADVVLLVLAIQTFKLPVHVPDFVDDAGPIDVRMGRGVAAADGDQARCALRAGSPPTAGRAGRGRWTGPASGSGWQGRRSPIRGVNGSRRNRRRVRARPGWSRRTTGACRRV